jgi:hypothetical protein
MDSRLRGNDEEGMTVSQNPGHLVISIRDRLFGLRYLLANSTPFAGAIRVVGSVVSVIA